MDDNEFRDVVALRAEVPVEVADRVIVAMQETVLIALRANDDVVLNGFGMWHRPVHSDETPAFTFFATVGEPHPAIPVEFIEDYEPDQRVALAAYLSENRPRVNAFDIDHDRYSGLDARYKPEVITTKEARRAALNGTNGVSTISIANRVVENLRVSLG